MSIRTIIAALSLEADSEPVLERALQLASQHGARLILGHAVETIGDAAMWTAAGAVPPLSALQREAEDHIGRMISSDRSQNAVEIVVSTGAPHALIHGLVQREQADLLVIGPGKPQTIRERLFGSTADRLVRLSPCPVLVVRNAHPARYEKIVVATDFSALSGAAFRAAADLAQGTAIDLVHIVDIPLQFEQALLKAGTPPDEIERYRRARTTAARKQLQEFLADQHRISSPARMRIVHGTPGDSLIALSRSGETDLLAIGLQGQNIVARALLGSVAQRVLQSAGCDVLAIGATELP